MAKSISGDNIKGGKVKKYHEETSNSKTLPQQQRRGILTLAARLNITNLRAPRARHISQQRRDDHRQASSLPHAA